jgi:hypothetical protein
LVINVFGIKDGGHAFMNEQKLNREVSATARYILIVNKLDAFTTDTLCQEFNLHTFEDLGRLSAERIAGTTLLPWQKSFLTDLCAHCRDRETYKEWRRTKSANMERVLDDLESGGWLKSEDRQRHALRGLLGALTGRAPVTGGSKKRVNVSMVGRGACDSIRFPDLNSSVEEFLAHYCQDIRVELSTCRVTLNGHAYQLREDAKVRDLDDAPGTRWPEFVIYS